MVRVCFFKVFFDHVATHVAKGGKVLDSIRGYAEQAPHIYNGSTYILSCIGPLLGWLCQLRYVGFDGCYTPA